MNDTQQHDDDASGQPGNGGQYNVYGQGAGQSGNGPYQGQHEGQYQSAPGYGASGAPNYSMPGYNGQGYYGSNYGAPNAVPQAPRQHIVDRFFNWIRRSGLVRGQRRWVGGVCSGLGYYFGVSEALVRAIIFGVTLVCGAGAMFYALAWALLPDVGDGRIPAEDLIRGGRWGECVGALVLFVLVVWIPGVGAATFVVSLAVLLLLVNSGVHRAARRGPQGGFGYGNGNGGGYGSGWGPAGPIPPNLQYQGQRNQPMGGVPYHTDGSATSSQTYHSVDGEAYEQSTSTSTDWQSPAESEPLGSHASAASTPFGGGYASTQMPPYQPSPVLQPTRKPKRLRRRPAGVALTLGTLGLVFVAAAAAVAVIEVNNLYLHDTLQVVSMAVALVCVALGVLVLVLGVMGRRAGGVKLAAFIVAAVAVFVISLDGGYVVRLQAMNGFGNYGPKVSVSGEEHIGATRAEMRQLQRGMRFMGESYDSSIVDIDLSDYAKTFGTHKITQENGKTVDSSCPAGRINLAAKDAQVFITLPKDCTFVLTDNIDGEILSYRRSDGRRAELYSEPDGKRNLKSIGEKTDAKQQRHHRHHYEDDYGDSDDDDSDDPNDDEDEDYDDYEDENNDFGEYDDYAENQHWLGYGSWNSGSSLGVNSLGSPYSSGYVGGGSYLGYGQLRGFASGPDYGWTNSSSAMPDNGPELVVSAPALIEAQVHVGYPGDIHIPSRSK